MASKEDKKIDPMTTVYGILYLLMWIFALYLSFRCNNGFDFLHFCCAYYYAPCYVLYALATHYNVCFN